MWASTALDPSRSYVEASCADRWAQDIKKLSRGACEFRLCHRDFVQSCPRVVVVVVRCGSFVLVVLLHRLMRIIRVQRYQCIGFAWVCAFWRCTSKKLKRRTKDDYSLISIIRAWTSRSRVVVAACPALPWACPVVPSSLCRPSFEALPSNPSPPSNASALKVTA
jgi:hypothetical protein